jgi:endonuclease/exonuclease/phosphatase family metal-dependent hydrolase
VTVFSTHLDHRDRNTKRLGEAKTLLEQLHGQRLIVAGDFNQQRERDYTTAEWALIQASKAHRASLQDDGVAAAFAAAGFQCCFDMPCSQRGWSAASPPPSTHWTGTVVDYAYAKGSVRLEGVFVVPSDLSDHRPVICDWGVMP